MPREVIMPALGMAQDSGRIVAWLKSAGDAVKAGDALFEVETDKATMEVEAAEDGFLSQPRFEAGQDVPVGEVIAVIAASADEARTAEAAADGAVEGDPAPSGAASDGGDLPPGREVIMPALGMAQDSGRIVAWHKTPGDAVAAADILFEVETDKATMEVEAGHDGYLAATLGHAGEDVPVGHPVAVIASEQPDTPIARGVAERPAAATRPAAQPPGAAAGEGGSTPPEPAPSANPGARILASPKARRLARERGLDLAGLVRMGVPQPFHVADLDTLAAAPAERAGPATAAPRTEVTATAPAAALAEFLGFAATETAAPVPRAGVLAAFAAAALRTAQGGDGPVAVRCGDLHGTALYIDPDLAGVGALAADDADETAAALLTLRDLGATRVTGARLAHKSGVEIVVTASADDTLSLQLSADPAALPDDAALALLDGVAQRLADPMRHLL